MMDDRRMTLNAVFSIRPEAEFSVGTTYESLTWRDKIQTKPTEKEFDEALVTEKEKYSATEYQRDRQYPQLGEQLDMLFHDMTAGKGTKDGEWYKAIAKVKTDNPKPTE